MFNCKKNSYSKAKVAFQSYSIDESLNSYFVDCNGIIYNKKYCCTYLFLKNNNPTITKVN